MIVYLGKYRKPYTYRLLKSLDNIKWLEKAVDKLRVLPFLERVEEFLEKLPFFKRITYIKYHKYDTWNLDHTLALIALPGLKQLKATKKSIAHIDDEDVPQNLRSGVSKAEESFEATAAKYEYALDCMIWSFELHINDEIDLISLEDYQSMTAKKEAGFRLFGKYFSSLWD